VHFGGIVRNLPFNGGIDAHRPFRGSRGSGRHKRDS